jgi:hypothetical protein
MVDARRSNPSTEMRPAIENAGRILDSKGSSFQAVMPLPGFGQIELRWKSDDFSCALVSFVADGEMLSTDAILSGLRPEADRKVQQAGHALIQDLCNSSSESAAEGVLGADRRPAIICIRWSTAERKGMNLVRDLEMCLAIAFLERGFQTAKLVF